MDVDGDVDGSLSQALSCMATSDHETLISQFQQILGEGHMLSNEACAFFLDMNSWNLQAALGAYYDFGGSNSWGSHPPEYVTELPSMRFVRDVTIGEGQSVPPSTRFTKTWRVCNTGMDWWPSGCFIKYMEGDKLSDIVKAWIQPLAPGEEVDVSIEMLSPADAGIYQSRWQFNTNTGIPFGESIWCIVIVDNLGILDITQQLASAPLGSSYRNPNPSNPFAGAMLLNNFKKVHSERNENVNDSDSMDQSGDDEPLANGTRNASLCNAVASRFPQAWIELGNRHNNPINDIDLTGTTSAPINIIQNEEAPDVPPCTPCTPPE